jgi:hypothetical protein
VEYAYAEIEAIEYHVADDHHGNQPEPDKTHHGEVLSLQVVKGERKTVIRREPLRRG